MKKIISVLFLLFLSNHFLNAQKNINFEILGIPDGLSNNTVWDVTQDKYGFLWIATADGLNRYDGYKFKIYKNDPDNPSSLPNNSLKSVLVDSKGTLWVGSDDGLSKFDYKTESFKNYLVDSSLAANSRINVFNLFEDSKNNLWINTTNGIARLNKEKDKIEICKLNMKGNIQESGGFSVSTVETSSGDIYSSTPSGFLKFNQINNYFEFTEITPEKYPSLKNSIILELHEDKAGRIWIASQNALINYDPQNKNIREIKLHQIDETKRNQNDNAYSGLYEDENGYLWIGTVSHGLYRLNLKTEEVTNYTRSDFPNISTLPSFFKFYCDSFNILWLCTFNNGLIKADFQKEPFKVHSNISEGSNSQIDNSITSIYKSNDDNSVWLGTRSGLINFKGSDKKNIYYTHSEQNKNSIPGNRIFKISSIVDNIIWIATNSGLSKYNTVKNTFENYKFSTNNYNSTTNYNVIFDITPDDYGNLWLASNNGLIKFDPNTNSRFYIPDITSRTYNPKLYTLVNTLRKNGNSIADILNPGNYANLNKDFAINENKKIMLVSVGEGLSNFGQVDFGWLESSGSDTVWTSSDYLKSFYLGGNTKNRVVISFAELNKGDYTLRYISDDSHSYGNWNTDAPVDSLWWGIQAFEVSDSIYNSYKSLLDENNDFPFINGGIVNTVEYDKSGAIWLGTDVGLSRYDIRKNKLSSLNELNPKANSLNGKTVNRITIDSDGIVWIAAEAGLGRYDQNKNQFNFFIDKDGLPSNYIRSIEEDLLGNLWLSSVNGITKYNKDINNPIFINYDIKDGLQGYVFNGSSSFKSKSGELFFGGQNGFNSFYPGNINKQPPKVVISELRIANEVMSTSSENTPLVKSIYDTDAITISYGQNNISFEFNAIHFSRPEKNQYAYKLEGFGDDNWIYNNRRFATYTNLEPGDYVFRVKASNGDGIWNEEGRSLKITVLPPWWRTYWAYIGYFLVFVGIIFGIDRIQRRRLLAKERSANAIREAELRAAAAEAQSRAVQAENDRKSKELEEARDLQLSMLPKNLPELPNLDIAVYMKTATEVGGDYYDFHIALDGTLTVVLGDATGHGMKAGTMVTAAKSLFNSYAPNPDILFTFSEMTRCIKLMHMHMLSMCMTMIKLKGNKLLMSCAGMPPILIYRKDNRTIEEHVIKGMPLGAFNNFPYQLKETELASGDTIMLMSDGFPELMNSEKELLGYKKVRNLFEEVAHKEPEEIITYLKEEGNSWTDNGIPDDDVTFVVLKVK